MKYFTFMVTDSEAEPYLPEEDNIVQWVKDVNALVGAGEADGDRLRPREEAKTVRVRNGELIVTDGPFTESKEWINGWGVNDFDDLDQAIEVMAKHPVARFGQIEIRPFFDWAAEA